MIKFDEESHTYTNEESGDKYISVTTLLGRYKPAFDKDKHSKRVADREGVTQDFVLEMWDIENRKATTRGTAIHRVMEKYISYNEKEDEHNILYESYDKCQQYISRYRKVYSEQLMHNHEYKIAGTADLIYDHGEYFTVGDFKTNKKFNFNSQYNEWLQHPVSHLQHCEFNDYALQLSMYAYMYEKHTRLKCKGLSIYYLIDGKWEMINCNYLKSDIQHILNDYALNNSNEKRVIAEKT